MVRINNNNKNDLADGMMTLYEDCMDCFRENKYNKDKTHGICIIQELLYKLLYFICLF